MTKPFPAIAILEFGDIPAGMFATDAMLKKAPIAFVQSGTITRGRFLTLIGGTTASVAEAYEEGLLWGGDDVWDHVFLPDVHNDIYRAVFHQTDMKGNLSLAVLEAESVSLTIQALERALKGTGIHLVEVRLGDAGLAGKGVAIVEGELHDVEEAMDLAGLWVRRAGRKASWKILTQPHEALVRQLADNTRFALNKGLELEGEVAS